MKNNIIFLIIVSIVIAGCASTEKVTKKTVEKKETKKVEVTEDVNLELDKNICWVNLMPGSDSKFHISGKVILLKGEDYDNNSAILKFVKVLQGNKELYYIMPKVINSVEGENVNITYSTIKGLSINDELNTKKPVDFELIFNEGKEELKYRINNILVEEVH